MKDAGSMDRYSTFGLRKEWLIQYFLKGDEWDWGGLGNKQVSSMKRWLQDSEIWDKSSKTASELGKIFLEYNRPNDLFVWSIIWHNLGVKGNSPLIRWYMLEIEKGDYKKEDLIRILGQYRGLNEANRTDINAIGALCNLFEQSPIGNEMGMGRIVKIENEKQKIYRKGQIGSIPDMAVLYSIYKYAENQQRKQLVASELVTSKEITPFWAYGLEYGAIKGSPNSIGFEIFRSPPYRILGES